MPINEAREKLRIPQNFLPYLDRHAIYDLFYDISVALVLNQPCDHVLFIRNYLCNLKTFNECIKVLIIGAPHIDKRSLAEEVASALNLLVVSLKDIREKDDTQGYHPKICAINLKNILQEKLKGKCGWVLFDYPRDRMEAREMKKAGIYPNHTFQLIPSTEYYSKRDLWNENLIGKDPKEFKEMIECYKRRLVDLKATFPSNIKEVIIKGRTLQQVARAMIIQTKQMSCKRGPTMPRVVIIGELTQKVVDAIKEICKLMQLVLINMEEVMCQGKIMNNELGNLMRKLEQQNMPIFGKIVIALIQERLMKIDCLNEGWIMVHFPRDRADLQALDSLDTPPNKVIFLMPTDPDVRDCLLKDTVLCVKPRDYAQEILDAFCKKGEEVCVVKRKPGECIPQKIESESEIDVCESTQKFKIQTDPEKTHYRFPYRNEKGKSKPPQQILNPMSVEQYKDLLDYCGKHSRFLDPFMSPENLKEAIIKYITDSPPCALPREPPTKEELLEQLLQVPQEIKDVFECFPEEHAPKKVKEFRRIATPDESVSRQYFSDVESIHEEEKVTSPPCVSETSSCIQVFPWKSVRKTREPCNLISHTLKGMKPASSSGFDSQSIS